MRTSVRCGHVDDAVERLLAGAVPPNEDEEFHAHAQECPSCEGLLGRIEGLLEGPPMPPEPDDLARRRGFLAMEARLRQAPPRIGWRPMIAAAAAVLVALGVGLAVGARGTPEVERIASEGPVGERWVAPPGGSATFDLGGGTRIVLSEGATARVTGVDGPTLRLTLASGLLVGTLEPGGPVERIFVSAPRGRVEVAGTVFAVRSTRNDDIVAVYEGIVQVISGDRNAEVRAGEALSVETMRPVDSRPLASMWRLVGLEVEEPATVAQAEAVEVAAPVEASEPTIVARAAPAARAGGQARSRTIEGIVQTLDGREREIALRNLADEYAAKSNRTLAIRAYRKLSRYAMTGSARANAFYEITQISTGETADNAWRSYLQLAPSGAAAQQAFRARMTYLHRIGRTADAQRLATGYLASFPNGAHSALANQILGR